MSMTKKKLLLAMLTAMVTVSAQANLITFNGVRNTTSSALPGAGGGDAAKSERDAFDLRVTISGTEKFSTIPVGYPLDAADTIPTSIGATISCDGSVFPSCTVSNAGGGDDAGRYDTTGDEAARFLSTIRLIGGNVVLDFGPAGINALGFYLTDAGDFRSSLTLRLTPSGSGEVINLSIFNLGPNDEAFSGNNLRFFGFYDDGRDAADRPITYSKVEFVNSLDTDVFGIDDIVAGRWNGTTGDNGTVPEPTSLALLGLALTAGAFARRRRAA